MDDSSFAILICMALLCSNGVISSAVSNEDSTRSSAIAIEDSVGWLLHRLPWVLHLRPRPLQSLSALRRHLFRFILLRHQQIFHHQSQCLHLMLLLRFEQICRFWISSFRAICCRFGYIEFTEWKINLLLYLDNFFIPFFIIYIICTHRNGSFNLLLIIFFLLKKLSIDSGKKNS